MNSSILLAAAAALLATAAHAERPPPAQQQAVAQPPLTLEEALALASGEQPAVAALQREAAASDQAAVAARSLPDPEVSVGIQNFPVTGRDAFTLDDMMTMLTIGVMREQIRRSKREAESARIGAEALVSRRQATAEERRIRRDVMLAWIDAAEASARGRLLGRIIEDLRTGRRVMEAGVQTGATAPALALQTEAEIALQQAERADAERAEARARAELSRRIGQVAASRPLPATVPEIEPPTGVPAEAFALAAHPSVQAAAAQQVAALREVDVARTARRPDISWSVMLGLRPKYGQMISGQVSIPLQINRRNLQGRQIAEAQLRADAAALRVEDIRRELEQEYRMAQADYVGAGAELERINRQGLPALEAAFKSAEARYSSGGQGESLDKAFEIVRRYVETIAKAEETRADRARAAARMIYVVGETGR